MGSPPPPLSGWTASRDLPAPPRESFRDWWSRSRGSRHEHRSRGGPGPDPGALGDTPHASTCHAPTAAGEQPAGTRFWSPSSSTGSRTTAPPSSRWQTMTRRSARRSRSAVAQRNPRGDRPGGRSGRWLGDACHRLPEGRRDRGTPRPRRRPRRGDRLGHRGRRDGDHRPRRQPRCGRRAITLVPDTHVRRAGRRRGTPSPRAWPGPTPPGPA